MCFIIKADSVTFGLERKKRGKTEIEKKKFSADTSVMHSSEVTSLVNKTDSPS